MLRIFKKRHPTVGARPGTLVIPDAAPPPRIRVLEYDVAGFAESERDVEDLPALRAASRKVWIDIEGVGDERVMRRIGEIFSIHPLALEDVVNAPQRPKVEEYEGQLLLITRMARLSGRSDLELDQLGIIVGDHYVLTFQERCAEMLDPVRVRLREGKGPIRTAPIGYLAYALLDTIVDGYYPVIEGLGEWIEELEDRVLTRPTPHTLNDLNRVKTLLALLRRALLPQREALTRMVRESSHLFPDEVRVYLRDTHDHTSQLVDVVESQRELVAGQMNSYLSVMANRTNEVMKVLTMISSIFIPLTLLAGIYGMNFRYMPELHARWGYPITLGLMAAIAIAMLFYFRRKGWLGGGDRSGRDRHRP